MNKGSSLESICICSPPQGMWKLEHLPFQVCRSVQNRYSTGGGGRRSVYPSADVGNSRIKVRAFSCALHQYSQDGLPWVATFPLARNSEGEPWSFLHVSLSFCLVLAMAHKKPLTGQDVSLHNSRESCWIIVHGMPHYDTSI